MKIEETPIHKKFGAWRVHINADISSEDGFEITFDRLVEENWFLTGISLEWQMNDFFQAYFEAAQLGGLDSITLQILPK